MDSVSDCERLGLIRNDEATDQLIGYLKDKDPLVRMSSARALFYGPKKAEKPLLEALKDGDDGVRTNVAAALSSIVLLDESSFGPLVNALEDDCAEVRANVVNALSRFIDQKVLKTLFKALKDRDSTVRRNALSGINYLVQDRQFPKRSKISSLLVPMLKDEDDHMRCTVAETLGLCHDQQALNALRTGLRDSSESVRLKAAWALGFMGCSPTTVDFC